MRRTALTEELAMNITMRKALIAAFPLLLLGCSTYPHHSYEASSYRTAAVRADPAEDLRVAMRKLWEDHITYTRNYIISAVGDLPDANDVLQRLMKNQEDIGSAIKPYYGDAAG